MSSNAPLDTDWETFPNPPIREALIDIRVDLPDGFDVKQFEQIGDEISDDFPNRKDQVAWQYQIAVQAPSAPKIDSSSKHAGYRFESEDNNKIVQTRLDGFTLNLISNYKSWEHLKEEAYKYWEIYCRVASPTRVVRVALRYINDIFLPLPLEDLSPYLQVRPEHPYEDSDTIEHFSRTVLHDKKYRISSVITLTAGPIKADIPVLPVVLDIDVFKSESMNIDGQAIDDTLMQLRDYKNRLFFASITEKTKEMFR